MNHPRPTDPIEVLEEEARAVARCFGVTACDEVAAALVDRIMMRLGGVHVYVPQRRTQDRVRVRKEIVRRFDGKNVEDLARDYSLTPRHVRRILASAALRP